MKFWQICLPVLLACFLCACGSDDEQSRPESAASSAKGAENASPASGGEGEVREFAALPQGKRLEPERAAREEQVLLFENRAREAFAHGQYAQPGSLLANSRHYLENWRLPPRPKNPAKKSLLPPEGLFDDREAKALTQAMNGMDKALADMLGHYAALEKYIADDSIIDDNRLGSQLAAKIATAHDDFMKARRSWLAIVENRAAKAEEYLLQTHPLQRQILLARKMFGQMRQISELIQLEKIDTGALRSLGRNLRDMAGEAALPPFPAAPALERLYRNFLKKVDVYVQALDMSLMEGVNDYQKKELNEALALCSEAYNEFARAANRQSPGSG